MKGIRSGERASCQSFCDALESWPHSGPCDSGELLQGLSSDLQAHVSKCGTCKAALEDFVQVRAMLSAFEERTAAPEAWFAQGVMRAIAAKEEEIEERKSSFWNGVRGLAPRLVAFATLVLVLGGTWAFQERRSWQSRQPELRPAESIFEAVPTAPANDDVIAGGYEAPSR